MTFFKNYFITGDYVVRGTSLWRKGGRGIAKTNIKTSGFPEDHVDVLAAFLYVQTAERQQESGIDHLKFEGNDLGPAGASMAKALNWDLATMPCWNPKRGNYRLVTYRADVLRFLRVKRNGKLAVNGEHAIQMPDAARVRDNDEDDDDEIDSDGPGQSGPRPVGASLVVIYRDPKQPLKAIVIYDGGVTKRKGETMNLTIQGFYQASSTNPVAKMTHIVGDGQRSSAELVLLDGRLVARNPFVGAEGRRWDDPTWVKLPLRPDADSASVTVGPNGHHADCLSWSAIVFETTVQDTDGDGLLDIWEESPVTLYDPNGQPLPNLHDMGANKNVKDLFVEIAYMDAAPGTTYGGVEKPAHSHLPTQAALDMVATAFKNAPVPINVHFDVGPTNYQPPPSATLCADPMTWTPGCAIIPASLARGGKSISETRACPDPLNSANIMECPPDGMPGQYPSYPGTVGWKTGFRFLRDELLGFDRNRKDMFRYALFAHSVGMPVEPCLNADDTSNFECQDTSPYFHVPRTNSGVADFPGGDVLVTLGAFDDTDHNPVASSFFQAGTLLHELGHTFELTHAGAPQIPRARNCNPPYLSSMNYLYQLRGLMDDAGQPHIDFSRQREPGDNESFLTDGVLGTATGGLPYRIGWYAPKSSSYLKEVGTAATKHCDGSELSDAEKVQLALVGGMVRVDGVSTQVTKIDWNADGGSESSFGQDVDFNGSFTALSETTDDWASIHLSQLGGRRSVGGFYVDRFGRNAVGPLSLDVGRGDIGRGDIGRGRHRARRHRARRHRPRGHRPWRHRAWRYRAR